MAQTFGQIVAEARESKGWTQSQLAGRVGVQRPLISKVEAGESCSLAVFRALVRALDLDPGAALEAPIAPSTETPEEEATTSV